MSEEVPLTPIGREQIHKLESALLIGSILRPDVLEELRKAEERLTWVDSLAVAAAALARERAKMTVSQIADELGRSEATIRNHLGGKTKAGQIVRETYERFLKEGVKLELPSIFELKQPSLEEAIRSGEVVKREEIEKLKERYEAEINDLKNQLSELRSKIESAKDALTRAMELLK
ncbi:MAG: transcriptional regulator [Candidatus Wolframiiraptor sp. EX4484-121]|nr:MAG: transcriptional regulator [Candidatus Wolframiiraptor sp. EX4484-121]